MIKRLLQGGFGYLCYLSALLVAPFKHLLTFLAHKPHHVGFSSPYAPGTDCCDLELTNLFSAALQSARSCHLMFTKSAPPHHHPPHNLCNPLPARKWHLCYDQSSASSAVMMAALLRQPSPEATSSSGNLGPDVEWDRRTWGLQIRRMGMCWYCHHLMRKSVAATHHHWPAAFTGKFEWPVEANSFISDT